MMPFSFPWIIHANLGLCSVLTHPEPDMRGVSRMAGMSANKCSQALVWGGNGEQFWVDGELMQSVVDRL